MKHLVFFLEELSAKRLLEGLFPRLLSQADWQIRYVVFEGKQDLEKQLERKLRGWQLPDTRFVILRDQDDADCQEVKDRLRDLARAAGRSDALIRIACRELESWILGDWQAVARAFDRPSLQKQATQKTYRDPDRLADPCMELRKHLPEYQKLDGAKRLGPLLDPASNRSVSFRAFCDGVRRLASR